MSDKPSFAKKPLLKRSVDAVLEAYEELTIKCEDEIREFLDGDIVTGAVSIVSGISIEDIIEQVVKTSLQEQRENQ